MHQFLYKRNNRNNSLFFLLVIHLSLSLSRLSPLSYSLFLCRPFRVDCTWTVRILLSPDLLSNLFISNCIEYRKRWQLSSRSHRHRLHRYGCAISINLNVFYNRRSVYGQYRFLCWGSFGSTALENIWHACDVYCSRGQTTAQPILIMSCEWVKVSARGNTMR